MFGETKSSSDPVVVTANYTQTPCPRVSEGDKLIRRPSQSRLSLRDQEAATAPRGAEPGLNTWPQHSSCYLQTAVLT